MIEIQPSNYPHAAPLLLSMAHHTVLRTLLAGMTPGYIYTNSSKNPTVAFAQYAQRAFISGTPDPGMAAELRDFILDQVFTNCRNAAVPLVRLAASDPAWITILAQALSDHDPILTGYQCYQRGTSGDLPDSTLPEGFTLRAVDAGLLKNDFKGREELLEEMCSERESVDAFLAQSFGITAFKENALAGWCLSEYNFEDRCEVGIATLPPYQRQGLARAMTRAFLEQARQHGVETVLWHCYASNTPSWKTALSTGFKLVEEQQNLELYLERSINLAVHGNFCFSNKAYSEALVWYQNALDEESPQPWMAWNAACAAAYIGQIDRAFDLLDRALDLGFTDLDHLKQSEHLTPLKSAPRWGGLITRLHQDLSDPHST